MTGGRWGMRRRLAAGLMAVALVAALSGGLRGHPADAADLPPLLTGGAGVGVLGNTPDGTAFALNGHLDFFVVKDLSVGPLFQMAFTDDSAQVGLSAQVKYWFEIPGTDRRLRIAPQAGIGFVHNTFRNDDTSWLIPIGVAVDYAVTNWLAVDGTLLINLTDLDTGRGTGTNVMPGFTVGVRF
jgi:hypothetical protein